MNKRIILISVLLILLAGIFGYEWMTMHRGNGAGNNPIFTISTSTVNTITYTNDQYKFNVTLPQTWKGYSIVMDTWKGNPGTEQGPLLSIRNPKWTTGKPYQDVPIMIFTLSQWDSLQKDQFHVGAAPINPSELGRNATYVFALPARYNFAYATGWEEVQAILDSRPLTTF